MADLRTLAGVFVDLCDWISAELRIYIIILVNVVMQCEELRRCWQRQWVETGGRRD